MSVARCGSSGRSWTGGSGCSVLRTFAAKCIGEGSEWQIITEIGRRLGAQGRNAGFHSRKGQVALFRSASLRIVATAELPTSVIIRHWGFDHPEVFRAQSSDPFPSPPLRPFSHSQNGGGPLERIRGARQGKGRVKRHPAHSTALSPTMRSNAQILVMGGGEAWLIRAHLRPAILPVENRPRAVVLRCRMLWRLGRCVNRPLRNAQPTRASWCTPVAAHRVRSCLIMPARRTESCQLAEQIRANSPKNSFCCTISQGHTNFRREGRR